MTVPRATGESTGGETYEESLRKNAFRYVPAKIGPAVLILANMAILARHMPPAEYGEYSLVISTAALLIPALSGWLTQSIFFFIPDYETPDRRRHFESQAVTAAAVLSFVMFGVAAATLAIFREPAICIFLGAFAVSMQLVHVCVTSLLQAENKASHAALLLIAQSAAQALVTYLLVRSFAPVAVIGLISLLGSFVLAIALAVVQRRRHGVDLAIRLGSIEWDLLKRLAGYGVPLSIWYFGYNALVFSDRFVLEYLHGSADLGRYAAIKDIGTGGISLATMPLLMASHPMILTMWKRGEPRQRVEELVNRNVAYLLLALVPVAALIRILGPELLHICLGARFQGESLLFLLVFIAIGLSALNMYSHKGLEVSGRVRIMAAIAVGAALVTVVANIFMIRQYGPLGAAGTAIFAQVMYGVAVQRAARSSIRLHVAWWLVARLVAWLAACELGRRAIGAMLPAHSRLELAARAVLWALATLLLWATSEEVRDLARSLRGLVRDLMGPRRAPEVS